MVRRQDWDSFEISVTGDGASVRVHRGVTVVPPAGLMPAVRPGGGRGASRTAPSAPRVESKSKGKSKRAIAAQRRGVLGRIIMKHGDVRAVATRFFAKWKTPGGTDTSGDADMEEGDKADPGGCSCPCSRFYSAPLPSEGRRVALAVGSGEAVARISGEGARRIPQWTRRTTEGSGPRFRGVPLTPTGVGGGTGSGIGRAARGGSRCGSIGVLRALGHPPSPSPRGDSHPLRSGPPRSLPPPPSRCDTQSPKGRWDVSRMHSGLDNSLTH